jgi:SAM-dependent methyltransferase
VRPRSVGWREPFDEVLFGPPSAVVAQYLPSVGDESAVDLPIPPPEMRELVGPTDPEAFDNPTGEPVYPYLPLDAYEAVLDFGCGCGRVARQLIQQRPRPQRYLGIDVHRGMIQWCRDNLTPQAPGFDFVHHDVFSAGLNPGEGKPDRAPFPVAANSFTLVQAFSIFTHLTEGQAQHYLSEAARVLRPDGVLHSTWFLFDKRDFPMMQDFQNALYINDVDPTNAVIFDREWLRYQARAVGLTIYRVMPPVYRGYQWFVLMAPSRRGLEEAEIPIDDAPVGRSPPPLLRPGAAEIGLTDEHSA